MGLVRHLVSNKQVRVLIMPIVAIDQGRPIRPLAICLPGMGPIAHGIRTGALSRVLVSQEVAILVMAQAAFFQAGAIAREIDMTPDMMAIILYDPEAIDPGVIDQEGTDREVIVRDVVTLTDAVVVRHEKSGWIARYVVGLHKVRDRNAQRAQGHRAAIRRLLVRPGLVVLLDQDPHPQTGLPQNHQQQISHPLGRQCAHALQQRRVPLVVHLQVNHRQAGPQDRLQVARVVEMAASPLL